MPLRLSKNSLWQASLTALYITHPRRSLIAIDLLEVLVIPLVTIPVHQTQSSVYGTCNSIPGSVTMSGVQKGERLNGYTRRQALQMSINRHPLGTTSNPLAFPHWAERQRPTHASPLCVLTRRSEVPDSHERLRRDPNLRMRYSCVRKRTGPGSP